MKLLLFRARPCAAAPTPPSFLLLNSYISRETTIFDRMDALTHTCDSTAPPKGNLVEKQLPRSQERLHLSYDCAKPTPTIPTGL